MVRATSASAIAAWVPTIAEATRDVAAPLPPRAKTPAKAADDTTGAATAPSATEAHHRLPCASRTCTSERAMAATATGRMAMSQRFTPSAPVPPSANSSACAVTTEPTANSARRGPSSAVASAPPSRWPLVPGRTGTFTICRANTSAAVAACGASRSGDRSRVGPSVPGPRRRVSIAAAVKTAAAVIPATNSVPLSIRWSGTCMVGFYPPTADPTRGDTTCSQWRG